MLHWVLRGQSRLLIILAVVLRCLAILETSNERTDDSSARADARQQR